MNQPFIQNQAFNFKDFFRSRSLLSRLIIINLAVWLGINLFKVILFLLQIHNFEFITYLAVPSNLDTLLAKPWTLITYMFTHEGFFHILFNMLVLYMGGTLFTGYFNDKKLLSTYIFGGLSGALFYIVFYNIFPAFKTEVSNSIALGASASVLAVLIAISVYMPNYTIYLLFIGRIKLIYVALILIAIDILSIDKSNSGGHLAHLGGALWGFIYVLQLRKGRDFSNMFNIFYQLVSSIKNQVSRLFNKRSKIKIEYKSETGRPLTDDEYNEMRADKQRKMDVILDKIAKSGYESLSKEEKEFLFKSSNK
jgi:membrane associated rhomboid family serine protease